MADEQGDDVAVGVLDGVAAAVWMPCSGCGREALFAPLDCGDGHGAECPERACTGCGAAVVVTGWDGCGAASSPIVTV